MASRRPPVDTGRDTDETWAFAAGRGLATLHAETDRLIDTYGQFQPQSGELAITEAGDWHTAAIAYVRRHRSVPDQHGHADIVDTVIDVLTDHSDLFEGAGNPVCCHGWATSEHVSVTDDRVSCMIDFEHALAAPGEFDYWRTVLTITSKAQIPPLLASPSNLGQEAIPYVYVVTTDIDAEASIAKAVKKRVPRADRCHRWVRSH
ncbi:phosphotransferase [Halocatena pleomorpha]|uniref:phosphotransferase n=1 Tax=Halocatena pleomorpha TaxID=1785090 RepID=UPI00163B0599|nr:phosphotransferase [Halocatena pleomorpha]